VPHGDCSAVGDGYISPVSQYPTLYEWAGGRAAFDRMIDAFYDRVEQDELLSPFFPGGVHEEHRRNVATWWSEVFGGPATYTEQLGGYERMLNKHQQLGITDRRSPSWCRSRSHPFAETSRRANSNLREVEVLMNCSSETVMGGVPRCRPSDPPATLSARSAGRH
jgi:truncated hemoglobin YjbI